MRCDQPTTIGKHGVGAGQLQRRDLHHRLTDGRTSHIFWDPRSTARISPATTSSRPIFITDETHTLFPVDLDPGFLLKAQLIGHFFQGPRPHANAHLVEKCVAGKAQGVGIADMTKASTVVIRKTMASIGDASFGVELGFRRELSRFHPGHRRDRLPSAARVVGIHRPTQQGLFGI